MDPQVKTQVVRRYYLEYEPQRKPESSLCNTHARARVSTDQVASSTCVLEETTSLGVSLDRVDHSSGTSDRPSLCPSFTCTLARSAHDRSTDVVIVKRHSLHVGEEDVFVCTGVSTATGRELHQGVHFPSQLHCARCLRRSDTLRHAPSFSASAMASVLDSHLLLAVLSVVTGAGTTLLAAKKLNRRYLGFDISIKYQRIFKQRYLDMFQEEAPVCSSLSSPVSLNTMT